MFIKQYREQMVRVADPLRPGKRIFEVRLVPAGGSGIKHKGTFFEADDDGWTDVPDEVGNFLRKFRGPKGEKFYTPDEVGEEVAVGRIKADEGDLPPAKTEAKEPEKKAAAKKAAA